MESKPEVTATPHVKELLMQALETERGGVEIYRSALACVQNSDLEQEWGKYLEETENHVQVLTKVLREIGYDPEATTPGCKVVSHIGEALVQAMQIAKSTGNLVSAELVAAECVVLAETKDHLNWHLLSQLAEALPGKQAEALRAACTIVEDEEDEHLYHTSGWLRELWLSALGLPSVVPPPEEVEDVHSAVEAAEAQEESEASR